MPVRQDVLGDRRFWASLYASSFGQIAESLDASDFCSLLGVKEPDVLDWYQAFTGWFPAIFDESDGISDDPAIIRIELANHIRLRVEFHPGDRYWFLQGEGEAELMLANIGPHWALPGLRWQEMVNIGNSSRGDHWTTVLLLLPIVWLTHGDDVRAACLAAESAWGASGLVTKTSASALARLWVKAVEDGCEFRWRRRTDGWICDAQWSTRSDGNHDVSLLNRIIGAAENVT